MPGKPEPTIIDQRQFRFTKKSQRFILRLQLTPTSESGILTIASKIRRVGASEWQEQLATVDVIVEGGD
jgi:hypothetical protein